MPEDVAKELMTVVQAALPRLTTLSEAMVTHRPAPDRWTIKEVLGHLIDSASNNHQRFVRAQFVSELVSPAYEQNEWVKSQNYNAIAWPELIEFWRRYNFHLAHVIRNIAPDALGVSCRIGDYAPVTLKFLTEDYVGHLKHHLVKIEERVKGETGDNYAPKPLKAVLTLLDNPVWRGQLQKKHETQRKGHSGYRQHDGHW